MERESDFFEAIRERPEEDGPLLIYADWLEEQGRPDRAELVRLQVAIDRGQGDEGARARARRLSGPIAQELAESLPLEGQVLWGGIERGAVRRATFVDVPAFLEGAEEAFRAAPLTRVGFDRLRPRDLAKLEDSPWLDWVGELDLSRPPMPLTVSRWLRDVRPLPGLRSLIVVNVQLGDEGAAAIAQSRGLARLESLDLSSNRIGNPGALALAKNAGGLPNLKTLDLGCNPVKKAGAVALVRSLALKTLRLAGTGMTLDAALALAEAPELERLEVLDLRQNLLSRNAVEPLRERLDGRLHV